jgi:hypothetical protein
MYFYWYFYLIFKYDTNNYPALTIVTTTSITGVEQRLVIKVAFFRLCGTHMPKILIFSKIRKFYKNIIIWKWKKYFYTYKSPVMPIYSLNENSNEISLT